MDRGALITIDGTVGESTRAPFVEARLTASGSDEVETVSHRGELEVVLEDGRRIEVTLTDGVIVRPERKVSDRWSTLRRHPVKPPGDYHADGRVKLRGAWIVPGEPIRVIGVPSGHAFVENTGGPRAAPQQEISAMAAVAIGVGEDSRDQADRAYRQVEKQQRRRERGPSMAVPRIGAGVWTVLALALIGAEIAWGRGTLGAGVTAAWLASTYLWWAAPHDVFPGGAREKDDDSEVEPKAHAILSTLLVLPLGIAFTVLADLPAKKNAGGCATIAMMGIYQLWSAWKGVLLRPRAVPGSQVRLPADPRVRWLVLIVMLAAWITSLVLTIPQMEGDGAPS